MKETKRPYTDPKFVETLQKVGVEGIQHAAQGFSTMVGQSLTVTDLSVGWISISDIPNILGGPEIVTAGIYIRSEGDFTAHIMLIIPLQKAYELVDMLMENPPGTTQHLGSMERSALAEVGNLTSSFFLSVFETSTGQISRPTAPAVIVDMVGAIMDIVSSTNGCVSDQVLFLKSTFTCGNRAMPANFWVIPDSPTFERISNPE